MTDRLHPADDIRKLEQDLVNLERCHAVLDRGARRVKVAFFAYLAALAVLTVGGIFLANGLLMSGMSFVILVASIILALLADMRGTRWIDVVGWQPGLAGPGSTIKRSEAQAVEGMIAECKARLALLQEHRS